MDTDKKTESEFLGGTAAPPYLKAPFPWFGGKSRAADLVWARFGTVRNYVEPFAGSLAVLLNRPIGRDHALDAHKGFGSNAQLENLTSWFDALAQRLRHVKVCCGDWQRVCTKAATFGQGLTAVLLDPPYDTNCGLDRVYGDLHSDTVSAEVRAWAIEQGKNPLMRIALCGYQGEHVMPGDWECVPWKASGGYAAAAGNTENSKRERIWFSPHCLKGEPELFKI